MIHKLLAAIVFGLGGAAMQVSAYITPEDAGKPIPFMPIAFAFVMAFIISFILNCTFLK